MGTNGDFVVVHVSDEFAAQYEAERERMRSDPAPRLAIVRDEAGGPEYVAMARLNWLDAGERLGVADLVHGWRQQEARPGDTVQY